MLRPELERRCVAVLLVTCASCSDPTLPIDIHTTPPIEEPASDSTPPIDEPVSGPVRGILFIREQHLEGWRAVHSLDLVTGTVTRLTPPAHWVIRFEVSPNGRRFAYTAQDHQGIFVRSVDDTSVTRLATQLTGTALPYMRWSPDGRRIAFQGGDYPNGEIGVVEISSASVLRLTNDIGEPIDDADPDWSPDGSRIVWTHGSEYDGFIEVWTMRADGSGKRRVSLPGGIGMHPRWSPGGDRIAYDNYYGIFTIAPDGSSPTAVTPSCSASTGICSRLREFGYPRWSPDGRSLAFIGRWSDSTDLGVYVAEAGGGSLREVRGLAYHPDPHWSPDGTLVAFTGATQRHNGTAWEFVEIFVARPDLSDLRPLTSFYGLDEMPRWHR